MSSLIGFIEKYFGIIEKRMEITNVVICSLIYKVFKSQLCPQSTNY